MPQIWDRNSAACLCGHFLCFEHQAEIIAHPRPAGPPRPQRSDTGVRDCDVPLVMFTGARMMVEQVVQVEPSQAAVRHEL